MLKQVSDSYPPPHDMYLVVRNGKVFTATPCYGMHNPWWVVRTMPEYWPNEADPVDMRDDDQWCPVLDGVRSLKFGVTT